MDWNIKRTGIEYIYNFSANKKVMKYNEINDILPRKQVDDLKEHLYKYSLLIENAINFGTHLLKWDAYKNREGDENLIPLLFFRNILELGDSISILIKNSSIEQCKPLLRSLLENTFGLEYLLQDDTYRRSLSYIVWHTHETIKFCDKLKSSTQSGKQLKRELEKDILLKVVNNFFDKPLFATAKQNAEDLLKLPKYVPINTEYQNTFSRKKNPKWYSLYGGPDNIEQLAKKLNLNAFYEIYYRIYSGNVHATSVFQNKLTSNSDGTVAIIQIRNPEEIQSVTKDTLNIIILSFLSYYKTRLSERKKDFNNWYMEFRKLSHEFFKDNFFKKDK